MMAPTLGTGVSSLPPEGALAAVGSAPGGGSAASMPLLQVRDLSVRFGAKEVVRGVGFDIAPGEKLALAAAQLVRKAVGPALGLGNAGLC